MPDRVHHLRGDCVPGRHRIGGNVRPCPRGADVGGDRTRHGRAWCTSGFVPVLDVVRDYRWGRVEETMGEDPYLVAMLVAAYVRVLQSAGVLATVKHFAGYSASRAARNHGPVSMGRRE